MRMKWAPLGVIVVISGCAATGPKYVDIATAFPAIGEGQGRIYFFRSDSMVGAAVQPAIKLNSLVIGKSEPGGFFFVDRPSGNYTVSTTTEVENSIAFNLEPKETKYIRTSVSMGVLVGHVKPTVEAPNVASAEISLLHYVGKSINSTSSIAVKPDGSSSPVVTQAPNSPKTSPFSVNDSVSIQNPSGNIVNNQTKVTFQQMANQVLVPFISEAGQKDYIRYLRLPLPRAFAISDNGHYGYAWPGSWKLGAPASEQERALNICAKYAGKECVLFSVDKEVVYDAPDFQKYYGDGM